MNGLSGLPEHPAVKRLLSPWGIVGVILAIFFLGEGYLAWRDRAIEAALENDPLFVTPAFELSFSKNFPYDPLNFTGKGAQAGLWKWSPEELLLTDEGRKYFEESGGRFVSRAPAGKRRIKRIRINAGTESGDRRIEFLYEWTEVSPPAAALLFPPPRQNEEYPAEARLTHEAGAWKVKSLRTLDYDLPLQHLQEAATGVLK